MDSIDFDRFDELINKSRRTGQIASAFEVLEQIMGTVTYTGVQFADSELETQLLEWYARHLIGLRDEAMKRPKQTPYRVERYDSPRVALARITAALEVLTVLGFVEKEESAAI